MTVSSESISSDEGREVGTVKRIFEAFARRDIDAALSFMHPQVRVWLITAAVTRGGRPYVGHDGVRQYFEDVGRMWKSLELVPVDFDQVGQAVVVLGEVRASGPAGELREPAVWTWKFTDGLVIDCRVDSDVRAARDALGRSETIERMLHGYVAAFNRRDIEAMLALADPAIVTYPVAISRSRRKYLGHQGLRNWIRDLLSSEVVYTIDAREIRKLEVDRWAVLGELQIDQEMISPFASLVHIVRGLITESREYLSEEALLRKLGHLP